jgi:hypothetical protein
VGVHGALAIAGALDTGFNPTTVGCDKNSMSYNWYATGEGEGRSVFGMAGGSPSSNLYARTNYFIINDGTGKAGTFDLSGAMSLERSASNRVDLFQEGISQSSYTTASTNLPNLNIYILAHNGSGTPTSPSTIPLAHFAITTKLTTQQRTDWVANELAYKNGL